MMTFQKLYKKHPTPETMLSEQILAVLKLRNTIAPMSCFEATMLKSYDSFQLRTNLHKLSYIYEKYPLMPLKSVV